jgi:hypothetical protein
VYGKSELLVQMMEDGARGGVTMTTVSSTDTAEQKEGRPDTASVEGPDDGRSDLIDKVMARLTPRRQYLIDRKRQMRSALLLAVVVLLLLLPLNYSLHTVRQQESVTIESANPELGPVMQTRDRTELIVGVMASVIILMGVFILTIIETHRTAGAAFAIVRRIDEIREGQYGTRLTLRGGDNLREIEGPFNAMINALRDRSIEEAETLARLADRAEGIVVPSEAESLAQKLRRMARRKREMAGTGTAPDANTEEQGPEVA